MDAATEKAQLALNAFGFLVISWPAERPIPNVIRYDIQSTAKHIPGIVQGPFRLVGMATLDDFRKQAALVGTAPDKAETTIKSLIREGWVFLKVVAE